MTSATAPGQLLRLLGLGFGIAIAVGEMIGSGIMRTPSLVAASVPVAGAILALWAFGALHAGLQANVLAELGTALPRVGGQYVFVRRALGDAAGLATGWAMWCAHVAGLAAACIAFADFLGLIWPWAAGHPAVAGIGLQIVLYTANVAGLREGRTLQGLTSLLKTTLLLAFAAAALTLAPVRVVLPPHVETPLGLLALAAAYQLIRGAYNGWHAPVYFAEENVAPARNIPRALFAGIALAGAVYLLVNAALLSALGPLGLAADKLPYATVLARVAGGWAAALFALGAMVTVASVANANVMIAPRVLYALARDRLLPAALVAVNQGGSPYRAFAPTAAVSILLVTIGGFRFVFGLIALLVTLASVLTEISYFVLRQREPALARPFRAKLHPWLPGLALAIDLVLLLLFALADWRGALFAGALCIVAVPLALARRPEPVP
jgi:amino acid transporter